MRFRSTATTYEPLPIPYNQDALEPVISVQTMELHTALYQGYATNLGNAQQALLSATTAPQMRDATDQVAFQGSGYCLHGVYFYNMQPGDTAPGPETQRAIAADFESMDKFKNLFLTTANAIPGPGWMVWGWNQRLGQTTLQAVHRHQDNTLTGTIPVLVLDVWEHAYLLDYLQDRAAYTAAWWNLINWDDVEQRLVSSMPAAQ